MRRKHDEGETARIDRTRITYYYQNNLLTYSNYLDTNMFLKSASANTNELNHGIDEIRNDTIFNRLSG